MPLTFGDPLAIYVCYTCDGRVTRDQITECEICMDYHCNNCVHEHNGMHCYDCGWRTLNHAPATTCGDCERTYCEPHNSAHNHFEYNGNDDGRYYNRPPVEGYGREASMNFIDDPYYPGDFVRGKRSAALEIEVEYNEGSPQPGTRQVCVLPQVVGIEGDGSISNGIEVTTAPAKGATLENIVTNTMIALRNHGYEAQRSCGLHTHIDLRDKQEDTKFMSHLFNAIFAVEDIFYAMQDVDRSRSHFCLPMRSQFSFFDMYGQKSGDFDFNYYKQPKTTDGKYYMDREKARKYANNRYMGFNFHSVYFRGSLECRIHAGSTDERVALGWIDILLAVIERVEKGHSYAAMQRLALMNVTPKKVNAFARYFGLSAAQKSFVVDRINRGQGFGFALDDEVRWGVPVKGRPKSREVRSRPLQYVGSRIECASCRYQFTLLRGYDECPSCYRRLMSDYGRNYTRVARAPRARPRNTTRVSTVFDELLTWRAGTDTYTSGNSGTGRRNINPITDI